MTTKKIVIIVAAVVVTAGLLVAVVVGGVIGLAVYSVGNSEAATTARDFLRSNEKLKHDIGEVKDFGKFVTGNVNVENGNGVASLQLSVEGEKKTVNASVNLMYSNGGQWRVTEASYKNDNGETIDLLGAYDAKLLPPGSSK